MMVLMNEIILGTVAAVTGAALGSFAGAQVWRLRARQLVEEKQAGEKVDAKEYKRLLPLTKQSVLTDRSIDLDTGKIVDKTTGDTFQAPPLPGFIQDIAKAGGLINYVKESK